MSHHYKNRISSKLNFNAFLYLDEVGVRRALTNMKIKRVKEKEHRLHVQIKTTNEHDQTFFGKQNCSNSNARLIQDNYNSFHRHAYHSFTNQIRRGTE